LGNSPACGSVFHGIACLLWLSPRVARSRTDLNHCFGSRQFTDGSNTLCELTYGLATPIDMVHMEIDLLLKVLCSERDKVTVLNEC
jgi:hypothetical protein